MARTQKEPVELSESDRKVSIQATFPGFDSQNMNYLLKWLNIYTTPMLELVAIMSISNLTRRMDQLPEL